ncbi:PREDICTED: multicopper oxidase LPR1-like isoform X2 [Nelumbo nucifera]|nr:PREDICTED: multicopper oxidase LPR1-like isoform X2 [Nelumbo nucifera]XP_010258943.1 PREDICTED: multicopper oxidase LPR1-like isoform X2 [Nelumbo nucifera]
MASELLLLARLSFLIIFTCSSAAPVTPTPITDTLLTQVAGSLQMFVDELPQMPKLLGYSNGAASPKPGSLTIGMYQTEWKFHRNLPPTTVFAFGTSEDAATVPGPTIEAIKGIPTSVTWQNNLPQTHILPWDPTIPTATAKQGGVPTVVHLHGGVHEPQHDGNPNAWFTSHFRETGSAWSKATYTYPNVQHSGNLWYHDHALGLTRVNILAGLIGAYNIRDPTLEASLNLPSGPEFDRNLMIFDRSFSRDGSLYINYTGIVPSIHPQWQPEYFGHAILVNGKAWPFMNVQKRKYRFRLTNAANARYFQLSLSNGLSFTQIGSDASYLPAPVQTQSILLSPSESADVVIDFSTSTATEIVMNNNAAYPNPTGSPVDNLNSKVMKFVNAPGNPRAPDSSKIPASLVNYKASTTDAAATTRYIVLYEYTTPSGSTTHLYINGKRYEDPVTETAKSGSTEIWEVINLTADNHPLHVHLATFQAIKIQQLSNQAQFTSCMTQNNDAVACNVASYLTGPLIDIPATEKTWKNTVKIPPGTQTTVVVKFNLVDTNSPFPFDATTQPGYVYHCHILDHEDNAMIRPLQLV